MYYIDCFGCSNSFIMNCEDKDCDELYCLENDKKVNECEFCNDFNK